MHAITRPSRFLLPAVVAALLVAAAPATAGPAVGKPAPDFVGTDSAGKAQRLSDYRGRTVILEWTNHECPYTVKHYKSGNMQALQKDTTKDGAVWLSVISSAPGEQGYVEADRANELTETRAAEPSAVILDPEGTIGRLYAAKTTPQMFVIDADGTLTYMGAIDDEPSNWGSDPLNAKNYVRLALADMDAGRPVAEPSTRPYGCSVKYR